MEFEYRGIDNAASGAFERPTDFKNDFFIKTSFRTGGLLLIFQILFLIIVFKKLPDEVPIFYSLPWGDMRLGEVKFLFLLPLLSFIILVLNLLIAKKLYNQERLLSRIISTVTSVFVIFCVITLIQVVYIVI